MQRAVDEVCPAGTAEPGFEESGCRPADALSRWAGRLRFAALLCLLLAFLSVWAARPAVNALGLPRAVASLDVPLVVLAAGLAAGVGRRRGSYRSWWVCIGSLVIVSAVAALSAVGVPNVSIVLGPALLLEPFLFLLTFLGLEPTARELSLALRVLVATFAIQLPLALLQFARHQEEPFPGDFVQGTLVGAGAGAHMLSAALLIGVTGAFLSKTRFLFKVICGGVVATVVYTADAKQVLAALPVAVAVLAVHRMIGKETTRLVRVGTGVLATVGVVGVLIAFSAGFFGNYLKYTLETRGGKIASTSAVVADLQDAGPRGLVGFGPGTTVTRFATLATPQNRKLGSGVDVLGIPVSPRAVHYQALTTAEGYVGTSSFTMAMSSLVGVLGDYGLVGLGLYVTLLAKVFRLLLLARGWLVYAAVVGWTLALVLGAISDGLEEPPLMLVVAVLTVLACADVPTGDGASRGRR